MYTISYDDILLESIGSNIKKARIEKKMTQQDIADKLTKLRIQHNGNDNRTPITRATISKYETGKLGISLSTLADLGNILDISISELFENQEIYNDNNNYKIKLVNFDKNIFNNLDNETKNKIIDDAIYELSKLKHEMNENK